MTVVLTVSALDLGLDRAVNYMRRVCKGYAVAEGRTQLQVKHAALLDPSAGDKVTGSIYRGATSLDVAIRSTPGKKIVLGYSQGAQIAGTWMRRFASLSDAPLPDELSFLLIGNPERRFGQQPWTKKQTPDGSQYRVRDVARRNDNWADWHGKSTDNRVLALFGSIHTNYWGVDPDQGEVIRTMGNTDYVVVP
jgi:hypothetical protein